MLFNAPIYYETDLILGAVEPPNGHIILRYQDGRNYVGTVKLGLPNGHGISTGIHWIYQGIWEDGIMIKGSMTHIYSRKVILIF